MTHLNCDELNRLKIRTPNSHSWPKVQIDKYFIRIYVIIDKSNLSKLLWPQIALTNDYNILHMNWNADCGVKHLLNLLISIAY